jgi:hypothetical protein
VELWGTDATYDSKRGCCVPGHVEEYRVSGKSGTGFHDRDIWCGK